MDAAVSGLRSGIRTPETIEANAAASRLERAAPFLLWAAVLAYVLVIGGLDFSRHLRFDSTAWDLGIYAHSMWLIAQGFNPYDTVRGAHILGDHFTPILYPLALFYRTPWGNELLLAVQTLALALGAWPLYRIGSRHGGAPWVGLMAGVTYLLYPPLRAMNLFDFHPIAMAVPGLLFALDYALQRRAVPCMVAGFWTLMCKEEAILAIACLAIWYAVRWRQPRALLVAGGAVAWFFVALRLVSILLHKESDHMARYNHLGDNMREVLLTFLLTPWRPVSTLNPGETLAYLLLMLAPLALLPLRAPGILWLLSVPLILNLFSNQVVQRMAHFQYLGLLIPILFAAAAIGLGRIPAGQKRRNAALAWAACTVVASFILIPHQQWVATTPSLETYEVTAVKQALQQIQAGASVSATNTLVPHLVDRKLVYMFPTPFWGVGYTPDRREQFKREGVDLVEYVVLSPRLMRRQGPFPLEEAEMVPIVSDFLALQEYGLVSSESGLWIFRRGADHQAGLKQLDLASAPTRASLERCVRERLETERIYMLARAR